MTLKSECSHFSDHFKLVVLGQVLLGNKSVAIKISINKMTDDINLRAQICMYKKLFTFPLTINFYFEPPFNLVVKVKVNQS